LQTQYSSRIPCVPGETDFSGIRTFERGIDVLKLIYIKAIYPQRTIFYWGKLFIWVNLVKKLSGSKKIWRGFCNIFLLNMVYSSDFWQFKKAYLTSAKMPTLHIVLRLLCR
jgi:hypothetical protein